VSNRRNLLRGISICPLRIVPHLQTTATRLAPSSALYCGVYCSKLVCSEPLWMTKVMRSMSSALFVNKGQLFTGCLHFWLCAHYFQRFETAHFARAIVLRCTLCGLNTSFIEAWALKQTVFLRLWICSCLPTVKCCLLNVSTSEDSAPHRHSETLRDITVCSPQKWQMIDYSRIGSSSSESVRTRFW